MYDAVAVNSTAGHYDLIAGTYYINVWPGKAGVQVMDKLSPDNGWTSDSLAGAGVR
ncbi:hypothetical protein D3C76_746690 [compost metagenome]